MEWALHSYSKKYFIPHSLAISKKYVSLRQINSPMRLNFLPEIMSEGLKKHVEIFKAPVYGYSSSISGVFISDWSLSLTCCYLEEEILSEAKESYKKNFGRCPKRGEEGRCPKCFFVIFLCSLNSFSVLKWYICLKSCKKTGKLIKLLNFLIGEQNL